MPDERPSLDAQLAALEERMARLRDFLPAPVPAEPPASPPTPETTARTILVLFMVGAVLLILWDIVAIFFQPDELVFVSREGDWFGVWETRSAYEDVTGKHWIEQPPDETIEVATFHGARRRQALTAIGGHVLLLALSVVAYRELGRLREHSEAAASPQQTDHANAASP